MNIFFRKRNTLVQLAGVVEYTDCISADSKTYGPMNVLIFDIKESEGYAPVMLNL